MHDGRAGSGAELQAKQCPRAISPRLRGRQC
nr:hypothetical protein [Serratia liquefaciens]